MASSSVEMLRRLTNEPESTSNYSDEQLSDLIATNETVTRAASALWMEKAAKYAELVDMQEGDSRRDLSDLHKNALAMAENFQDKAGIEDGAVGSRKTTVGRITRA